MKVTLNGNRNVKSFTTAIPGLFLLATVHAADPRTNCWFTADAGQYARIYTNSAMKTAGTPLTTWSNGAQTQSLPAYCGIQAVYSSSNWIYVRSTGLASYNMGPWFLNAQHTTEFPNLPVNQKLLYRFPRTGVVPAIKSLTGAGEVGIFVDGVEMFNSWDAYYWNGSADVSAGASSGGYWNRDAYVNEDVTFDAGYAHQQQNGTVHYHADPIALRYLLGDHVDYDASTQTYREATNAPTQHSPILCWVADGFPIYGPYGYANATNAASGIRRMISGYVPRNGQNGMDNLNYIGAARSTIPAWAQRAYGVSANQSGPAVSTSYPFGRYMEDNTYLGDLTNSATGSNYQQGVDFDLDEYNGRWCVTPEFPAGTYAYFVAIDANGTPVFPYNIGRAYYGTPAASSVSRITEDVTTNFLGEASHTPVMNPPTVQNGVVTLTWNALEGGTYLVQSSTNLMDWKTNATAVAATLNLGSYTNAAAGDLQFYRAARTALAAFDSAGSGGYTPVSYSYSPGGSATRGATVVVTNTLSVPPPSPPLNAPLPTVTLAGSIVGIDISHPATNIVVATFAIPTNAPTGSQNIVITFGNGTQPPPWANSFTINP